MPECRWGRAFEEAHPTCRSCLRQSEARCQGSLPIPKRTPKDWPGVLIGQIRLLKLPEPVREHRFCERRWRFDLAWPERLLAVEVDGGIHSNGRHVRGKGYTNDCVKLNRAALEGWTVLRVTTGMVSSGEAIGSLERALREGPCQSQPST